MRPLWARWRQAANTERLAHYVAALETYRVQHGAWPARLVEIARFGPPELRDGRDVYGNALRYEVRGDRFVLVSYGKDGQSDGLDPWRLRALAERGGVRVEACGATSMDLVFSDVGGLVRCSFGD